MNEIMRGLTRDTYQRNYQTPTFGEEVGAFWRNELPYYSAYEKYQQHQIPADPDYMAVKDIAGWEEYAPTLLEARSKREMDAMKDQIARIKHDDELMERGEWGILAGITAGVLDPINLIPLPLAGGGIGIVKAAARVGLASSALTLPQEVSRRFTDPTVEDWELYANVGMAGIVGGALGGAAQGLARGFQMRDGSTIARMRRMSRELSEAENNQLVMPLDNAEGMNIRYESVPARADGTRRTVDIVEEMGSYAPVRASNGRYYQWNDEVSDWIVSVDAGSASPRRAPESVRGELGEPNRRMEQTLVTDEVRLRMEYHRGEWRREGDEAIPDNLFTDPLDYIVYRQIQRVQEANAPIKEGETQAEFLARNTAESIEIFRNRKRKMDVEGGLFGLGEYLAKINFSPLSRAIRAMPGNNAWAKHMLSLGGDAGWMIRANKSGQRTPPSLILRSANHHQNYVKLKRQLDQLFNQYVTNNQQQGKEVMQWNYTAALNAANQRLRQVRGESVLTYRDFMDAVGRAVYDDSDFSIRGIPVPEQAREGAKAVTRVLEQYEKLLKDRHMFSDKRSFEKASVEVAKAERLATRKITQMMRAEGVLDDLDAAIKLQDGRIFRGDTHDAARNAVIDTLGDEGYDLLRTAEEGWAGRNERARNPGQAGSVDPEFDPFDGQALQARSRLAEELIAEGDPERVMNAWINDEISIIDLIKPDEQEMEKYLQSWVERITGQPNSQLRVSSMTIDPELFGSYDIGRGGPLGLLTVGLEQGAWDAFRQSRRFFNKDMFADLKRKAPEQALGMFADRIDQTRSLASRAYMDTAAHETIHFFRNNGMITPWEDDLLRRTAADEGWYDAVDTDFYQKFYSEQGYNQAEIDELMFEEAVASRFGLFVREKMRGKDASTFGKVGTIFEKVYEAIVDFFRGMEFRQEGIETAEQMFDYILAGGLSERIPDPNSKLGGLRRATRAAVRPSNPVWESDDLVARGFRKGLLDADAQIVHQRMDAIREHHRNTKNSLRQRAEQIEDIDGSRGENYWERKYDTSAIGADREKFTYLIQRFLEDDRQDNWNVGEDAASIVDTIMLRGRDREVNLWDDIMLRAPGSGSESGSAREGSAFLSSRRLTMPNKFRVTHPEWGEIRLSDYIENNALGVMESYVRRTGAKIEANDMFGDWRITGKKSEFELDMLTDTLARSRSGEEPLEEGFKRIDEAMNWHQLTWESVLGRLKSRDPWAPDNRTARFARNWSQLSMMGMSTLASLPELVRPMMINGFADGFKGIWLRMTDDLANTQFTREFMNQSGELADMTMSGINARVFENQTVESYAGGTRFERWLQEIVPDFYKFVGLTPFTMAMKDLTMYTAMHVIMRDARAIAAGAADEKTVARLAAAGVGLPEASLLARMPVIERNHGVLQADLREWQLTPDGRRASRFLLDAVHSEARRGIVTPSSADKPLIMHGIWASSEGRKIAETDLMTLPFQFMSYGIGAMQKVTLSALQGRDRAVVGGMMSMLMLGMMANYFKMPNVAWQNKTNGETLLEAWEASGLGGFWFGDINLMIERASGNQIGARPLFGMDPKYGDGDEINVTDALGPGFGTVYDLARAFTDADASATERAQIIRRAILFNNVIYWKRLSTNMANNVGEAFE